MVFSSNSYGQKGQALLVVVLAMVVFLTVGLSVASRSITNLRISNEEENSQRAFSAAEAGVEKAIQSGQGVNTAIDLGNNSQISQVSVVSVSGTDFVMNSGNPLLKDDGTDLWLSDYNAQNPALNFQNPWSGTANIFWGNPTSDCNNAALEVIVISGTRASPQTQRFAYDPCADRRTKNNFSAPQAGGTVGGKNFPYKAGIPIASGLIARVVPLYVSSPLGVSGTSALPLQGNVISSTGASGTTTRKLSLFQGFPELPTEFFPYILFSPKP